MEVLLDTTMLHPITLFGQRDRLMMLYLNADGEMQIGEITAGRLHPVRSVEGVVEDCGVALTLRMLTQCSISGSRRMGKGSLSLRRKGMVL